MSAELIRSTKYRRARLISANHSQTITLLVITGRELISELSRCSILYHTLVSVFLMQLDTHLFSLGVEHVSIDLQELIVILSQTDWVSFYDM